MFTNNCYERNSRCWGRLHEDDIWTIVEDTFVLFTWVDLTRVKNLKLSGDTLFCPCGISGVGLILETMTGSTWKDGTVDLKSKEQIRRVIRWKLQCLWPSRGTRRTNFKEGISPKTVLRSRGKLFGGLWSNSYFLYSLRVGYGRRVWK